MTQATHLLRACVPLLALALPSLASAQLFEDGVTIHTFNTPFDELLVDLNDDGFTDVLWADYYSEGWFWKESDGGGGYSAKRPLAQLGETSDDHPTPATADLDGDGDGDIVYLSAGGVQTWLGRPGGFDPLPLESPATAGLNLEDLKLMDADGDGNIDLMCIQQLAFGRRGVSICLNDGTGCFGVPQMISAANDMPLAYGLGDADNDGLTDVLIERNSRAVYLKNLGGGQFSTVNVLTNGQVFNIYGSQLIDVNDDGVDDLVHMVGVSGPDPMSIYLGQGGGSFASPVVLTCDPELFLRLDYLVRDVTGDGMVDVLVESDNKVGYFERVAAGQWSAFQALDLGEAYVSRLIGLEDLNFDGRDDLVTWGNSGGSLLLVAYGSAGPERFGPLTPLGNQLDVSGFTTLAVAELDGAAPAEIVAGWGFSAPDSVTTIAALSGALSSLSYQFFDAGGIRGMNEMEGCDLTGDGLDELLVQDLFGELFCVQNLGGGQLAVPESIGFAAMGRWEVGDADGDGDLDLITSRTSYSVDLYENSGGSFLAPIQLLKAAGPIGSLRFGDLNADGLSEIIVTSHGPVSDLILLPNQGGTFGSPLSVLVAPPVITDAAVGDFDGDGRNDIVVSTNTVAGLVLLKGDGALGLAPPVDAGPVEPHMQLEIHDLDNDGSLDLVGARFIGTFTTREYFLLNDGSGGFTTSDTVETRRSRGLTDLDLDGDLDLIVHGTNSLDVHRGIGKSLVGTSYCGPAIPHTLGLDPASLQAFDSSAVGGMGPTMEGMNLPAGATVLFLASRTPGVTFPVTGSDGRLCLTGQVGRFLGPQQVQIADPSGRAFLELDSTALPTPSGLVQAAPGETWYFQGWFRSSYNSNNFTDGLSITFQ